MSAGSNKNKLAMEAFNRISNKLNDALLDLELLKNVLRLQTLAAAPSAGNPDDHSKLQAKVDSEVNGNGELVVVDLVSELTESKMRIEELTANLSQASEESEAKSLKMDLMIEKIVSKMDSLLEKNESVNGGSSGNGTVNGGTSGIMLSDAQSSEMIEIDGGATHLEPEKEICKKVIEMDLDRLSVMTLIRELMKSKKLFPVEDLAALKNEIKFAEFKEMLDTIDDGNMKLLAEQMTLCLPFLTSDCLEEVVNLIFEKAISESELASTCSRFCKMIASVTINSPIEKKKTIKARLITRCQMEFERVKEETIVFDGIKAKLLAIKSQPDQEKYEAEKTRLEKIYARMRQRANGTAIFIGKLCIVDIFTSHIIGICIDMLLQENTEEKLERVCKLLTITGAKLERQDNFKSLDRYFQQLEVVLHSNNWSAESKLAVQNLKVLRKNRWKQNIAL